MGLSSLSILSLVLGGAALTGGLFGLCNPDRAAAMARRFPRSIPAGYITVGIAAAWFIYYLHTEAMADFAPYRGPLTMFFLGLAVAVCIFVRDYLAVRGLAVIMLLLAKLMTDTARWVDTDWRLVIVVLAYALVLAGMWFTVTPWRLRDLIQWATVSPRRVRVLGAVRLAVGVLLVILALTAYRNA